MMAQFICPACKSQKLVAKYEAKYVYSYIIDSDNPGRLNTDEFYPFLYDKREQTESKQYVECTQCGTQYPCSFTTDNKGVESEVLKNSRASSFPW
jgi:transcription elongation factor Elf1